MFIIERLLSFVAPHYCLICGDEGAVVCDWCLPDIAAPLPARCYRCKAATRDSAVCQRCRRMSSLKYVWVRAAYEDNAKQLIHDFKFERRQAAAEPIVRLITETLPYLPPHTTIAHVPTATSRVRRRGYDPAELIARTLAKALGLEHKSLLARVTQTRQVGAKREDRIKQMERAFRVTGTPSQDETILLIDDLTTTGATLEAAARCLREAGVKTVHAAVFAQKQ